jgi:LPS export ABC transporter protein LptC
MCALAGFAAMLILMLWNAKNLAGFKRGALLNMLPANVDMRLGNLTLSETDGEGRSMAVKAESAHYFKDDDYFLLNEIAASIDSSGAAYSVAAKAGRYEPKDKLVFLTGGVRSSDNRGKVLTSARLDLDMLEGTISSASEFCLEDPDMSLSGSSFVYDSKNGRLDVEGRVFMLISQPAAGRGSAPPAPGDGGEGALPEALAPPGALEPQDAPERP